MQIERDSTRQNQLHNADSTSENAVSSPALPSQEEILARLGGRFAADVASLLKRPPSAQIITPEPDPVQTASTVDYGIRQFAIARIKANNIEGAIDFIERHTPDQREWLDAQIRYIAPYYFMNPKPFAEQIEVIPEETNTSENYSILIDPEAGRIALALGQFTLFRAWVYALDADNGDGWLSRDELEQVWKDTGIANGKRQSRRLIQHGIEAGYWSQDRNTQRIYLSGQLKLSKQLIRAASAQPELYETNKPGKRRIHVDLSGSLQRASAKLYSAWLVSKDRHDSGIMISRKMLFTLWNTSVPTLLKWERAVRIRKHSNYAQSNVTAINGIPAHAYLTLNRNGNYSTAWRLPNTYKVTDKHIHEHTRTGKSRRIRKAICAEIADSEQRGSIGDTALPRSGRRYFACSTMPDRSKKVTPYRACDRYLRKVGRQRDGDLQTPRYFYLGKRHGARVFEAFNIKKQSQQTSLNQRLIWKESRGNFSAIRAHHRSMLVDGF